MRVAMLRARHYDRRAMPGPLLPLLWDGRQGGGVGGGYRGTGEDPRRVGALWSLVLVRHLQFVFAEQRASLGPARVAWGTAVAVLVVLGLHGKTGGFGAFGVAWFGVLSLVAAGGWAAVEAARLEPPALPNPAALDIDACPGCAAPARRSAGRCPLCGAGLDPGIGAGSRVQAAVRAHFGLALHRVWPYAGWMWAGTGWVVCWLAVLLLVATLAPRSPALPGAIAAAWPIAAGSLAAAVFARSLVGSLRRARALRAALGRPLVVTAGESLRALGVLAIPPPTTLPALAVELRAAWSWRHVLEWMAPIGVVLAVAARVSVALAGGLAALAGLVGVVAGARTRVTLGPDGVRARRRWRRDVFVPREQLAAITCSPRAVWSSLGAIDRWALVAVTRAGDEVVLAPVREQACESSEVARLAAPLTAHALGEADAHSSQE